jgi:hypothetical protein
VPSHENPQKQWAGPRTIADRSLIPGDRPLARAVLDAAAEVEAAEAAIKDAVVKAMDSQDMDRMVRIIRRWCTLPPTEVLHGLGLAPCGKPEVQDKRRPEDGV